MWAGTAVMLYTEPRYTNDLDLWVEASAPNAARVFQSLAEFGSPLSGLGPADFASEGFFYQVGRPPVHIDILMSIDGLTFEDTWPNRNQSTLGRVTAWFISRADLIKNERTSARHIDLHDAELLE